MWEQPGAAGSLRLGTPRHNLAPRSEGPRRQIGRSQQFTSRDAEQIPRNLVLKYLIRSRINLRLYKLAILSESSFGVV